MAVKGLLEGGSGGRLGVWGPRTPKLPRAPRNGDPALLPGQTIVSDSASIFSKIARARFYISYAS